jgi:hypothetical protein
MSDEKREKDMAKALEQVKRVQVSNEKVMNTAKKIMAKRKALFERLAKN